MYADDTTIAVRAKESQVAVMEADIVLGKAEDWFESNGLFLNKTKTQTLIMGRRAEVWREDNLPVRMLGVYIDGAGTWKAHCKSVSSALSSVLFLLRSLKGTVTETVLLQVYWACFHSKMLYCILVWGHSVWSKEIFKMQRRAIRLIGNLGYRDDCRATYRRLGILTQPCTYIMKCLEYVASHRESFTSIRDTHGYCTRRETDLSTQFIRLEACRNAETYYAIKFFNALPTSVRKLEACAFRKLIKTFLCESVFYSFEEYCNGAGKWDPITR